MAQILIVAAATLSAAAQEPAILTADAFPLGRGSAQVSYGAEYSAKDEPVGEGSLRWLVRALPASARIGVGANVDIIAGWRGRLFARTGGGTSFRDWGDPSIYTKITLTDSGGSLAAGVLFGFKIPSSRYYPAFLGSDAMDGYFIAAVTQRFAGGEIRLNAGAGIVGDPKFTGSQDDLLTGSALALWRPVSGTAVFAELYGFTGPKEDDDKLQLRGGVSIEAPSGVISIYGLGRLAGNPRDFSTAFLGSPEWGIGMSMSHRFDF